MAISSSRGRLTAGLFAFVVLVACRPSYAEEPRLAISGYDAVAYFTDGKPVPGQSRFEYLWHDARWRFASQPHLDAFVKEPNRYAPQYDGYCAVGVALEKGHKDTVDPEAWAIVDGKLYLTYNKEALAFWQKNAAENIGRANENWPEVKQQTVMYNGYPNVQKQ